MKYEDLPEDIREASMGPYLMSDDISPKVCRIIDAIFDGNSEATMNALSDLRNYIKLKIQNAEDVGKLSVIPEESLRELKESIRQAERYLAKIEMSIDKAINIGYKK